MKSFDKDLFYLADPFGTVSEYLASNELSSTTSLSTPHSKKQQSFAFVNNFLKYFRRIENPIGLLQIFLHWIHSDFVSQSSGSTPHCSSILLLIILKAK